MEKQYNITTEEKIAAIEEYIQRSFRSEISGFRPEYEISIDFIHYNSNDKNFGTGCKGSGTYGLFKRRTWKNSPLLSNAQFSKLVNLLGEESHELDRGPFYKCIISYKNGHCDFTYGYQKDPVNSVDDLMLDNEGRIPRFYLFRCFNEEIIQEMSLSTLGSWISIYVCDATERGKAVRTNLLQAYAVVDWLFSAERYGIKNYYLRQRDECDLFNRQTLFKWILKQFDESGDSEGKAIFSDGLSISAHGNEELEQLRKELDVGWTDELSLDNLHDEFFKSYEEIEKRLFNHIKENPSNYADEG